MLYFCPCDCFVMSVCASWSLHPSSLFFFLFHLCLLVLLSGICSELYLLIMLLSFGVYFCCCFYYAKALFSFINVAFYKKKIPWFWCTDAISCHISLRIMMIVLSPITCASFELPFSVVLICFLILKAFFCSLEILIHSRLSKGDWESLMMVWVWGGGLSTEGFKVIWMGCSLGKPLFLVSLVLSSWADPIPRVLF